jgi:hypothetical protein
MNVPVSDVSGESVGRAKIDVLTGFRGIAAYTVLLAHAIDLSFGYLPSADVHSAASRLAYLGMSLFFVLSGFVIFYNYARIFRTEGFGSAVYQFLVARFARLYPLYALSIIISLNYIPSPAFAGDPATAFSYLTLTQSWTNRQSAIFEPDWSISTEWFFYFAFIPLSFVLHRLRRTSIALTALIVAVPIGLMILSFNMNAVVAALTPFLSHGNVVSAPVWPWLTYYSPYVRIFEFLAGALTAKLYMSLRESPVHLTPARLGIMIACGTWCAVVLFTSIGQTPLLFNLGSNFIYAPALVVLIFFACRYESAFGRFLESPALKFMGEISFSVYIWGWYVMTLFSPHFTSAAPSAIAVFNSLVKVVAILGVTTIIALGSYRLVESPPRKWLRTLFLSRGEPLPGKGGSPKPI